MSWGFIQNYPYIRRSDIHGRFGGQQQGGICTPRSHPLVIAFTGATGQAHGYADYFAPDGTFCLFGEGQIGDMNFTRGNRAIRDHVRDGKDLLLFEMLGRGRVRFLGTRVCGGWHMELANDRNGASRQAIVFHLFPVFEEQEAKEVSHPPMSFEDLRQKAYEAGTHTPKHTAGASNAYWERSAIVRDYVLARAGGTCEICGSDAPFSKPNGQVYLEAHHIRRLSDGGPDDPRFVAAVCPNCHREAHHGQKRKEIRESLLARVAAIEKHY